MPIMTPDDQPGETPESGGIFEIVCPTPEDLGGVTAALAAELAAGDVVFLLGELGAGKTTLTQYLARALAVGEEQYVASPSFALLHEYSGRLPVFHMDLYRLRDEEDVEAAGLLEYLEQQGVTIIEWPERLGSQAPADRLDLHIEVAPDGVRHLTLLPRSEVWQHKLRRMSATLAATREP